MKRKNIDTGLYRAVLRRRTAMPSLMNRGLDFVTVVLRAARQREFPDVTVTRDASELFNADFAGAGWVDFCGTGSRRWADMPNPVPLQMNFHEFAVRHPLIEAYRRSGKREPLRLSDIPATAPTSQTVHWLQESGLSHLLMVPLSVTRRQMCSLALLRSDADFSTQDVNLGRRIQSVLEGIQHLRARTSGRAVDADHGYPISSYDPDTGIPLTARELAVLDLLADGLITAAIARQLGISPHTVRKHIENIYRKLGTHDRVNTILRARQRGTRGC